VSKTKGICSRAPSRIKVAPEERPSCENPPLCCKCSHNHITLPQARAGKAFHFQVYCSGREGRNGPQGGSYPASSTLAALAPSSEDVGGGIQVFIGWIRTYANARLKPSLALFLRGKWLWLCPVNLGSVPRTRLDNPTFACSPASDLRGAKGNKKRERRVESQGLLSSLFFLSSFLSSFPSVSTFTFHFSFLSLFPLFFRDPLLFLFSELPEPIKYARVGLERRYQE
jgi:hypothetical protein